MKKGMRKISSSYYTVLQSEYFPDQKPEDLQIYLKLQLPLMWQQHEVFDV